MKYLFQQMIAFWAIILTILIVVGVSFTFSTRNSMLANTYEQLKGYALSIQNLSSQNGPYDSIKLSEAVLAKQNVNIYYLNNENVVVYPNEYAGSDGQIFLDKEKWNDLKDGTPVEDTMLVSLNGKEIRAALVAVPSFQFTPASVFTGVIVVIQPLSNLEDSISVLTGNLFKGFLLSSFIALFISYALAKFQVNRINRMRTATHQIAHGNFDIHLQSKNKDELDDLAGDFNKMAESLKASHQEIERQEDLRRQFMADAAHEMRTPLTTINGMLEGLAYNVIPENQKAKGIELMQNETKRLIRLVNENLDYEKIRTNQITMMIRKFNATETLGTIVSQLTQKANEAGNQLSLETTEDIMVYADYDRFVQIMVNIIQNAIQFTTNGQITATIEKGYLETIVKISDTGIGMTEEEVQNIWDRYYKADPSRKNTKYGESGLGLSIVHQLVKLHKGTIQVESQKNIGTTFTISFPDIEIKENEELAEK